MRLLCALLAIVWGLSCVDSEPPAEFEPAALHELNYHYMWRDGAELFVNDLGYRIQVIKGAVSSYSIQLVPCEQDTVLGIILDLVVPSAFAGHSGVEVDPSLLESHYVETLPDGSAVYAGSVQVQSGRYCKAHYLVARAPNDASGLPSDWNMVDRSLFFELNYQAPGSEQWVATTIETDLAFGESFEIATVDMDTQGAHIVVNRSLSAAFDGVDFEQQSSMEIPWRVLENLVTSTVISVN
jgi:hypothetical protein